MATTAPPPATRSGAPSGRTSPTAELYEHAVRDGEGLLAADGPLVVRTGKHTGRSPKDKFIVDEPSSHDKVWWGAVNQPISEAHYDSLRGASSHTRARLFGQDCFIGADPAHRRSLRVYTETAWASIFAHNLFIRPTADQAPASRRTSRSSTPPLPCRPRDRRHPQRDGHPRPPQADGDPHRRHRVRRRDQEVRVHGHELPPARRGRPADALGHQRRQGRRRGRLLRPLRHRQDDALGRPAAQPHRRRRARLGRRHQRSTSKAAATPRRSASPRCTSRTSSDHAPLRDHPRERRSRPADPRARPRLGAVHREHPRRLPARLHRQRRPDRDRRHAAGA